MAAMASSPSFSTRMFSASPPTHSSSTRPSSALRASLSSNFNSPFVRGSFCGQFSSHKIQPQSFNPVISSSSRPKRDVVTMVIPFSKESAREQPPPDLASYLFKNRIVYLGMILVPAVVELLLAEFMYLQYQDDQKPIYFYINSTGTMKGDWKYGRETEAFAIYDIIRCVKPPILSLCVGNAWGEAAMLLAACTKGNRSALPSASIMIREPIARFQGQTTDVDLARRELKSLKTELALDGGDRMAFNRCTVSDLLALQLKLAGAFLGIPLRRLLICPFYNAVGIDGDIYHILKVRLLSRHIGKPPEVIEADIRRPKYFTPSEAVEYGIIDKVVYNVKSPTDRGLITELKKAPVI